MEYKIINISLYKNEDDKFLLFLLGFRMPEN